MWHRTRRAFGAVICVVFLGVSLSVAGVTGCRSVEGPVGDVIEPGGDQPSSPTPLASSSPATTSSVSAKPSPTVQAASSPVSQPAGSVGLSIDAPAADGSVSGAYRDPRAPDSQPVQFIVTTDGVAGFWLEGAPASEALTVIVANDGTASMTWAGTTLDGMGALTVKEQAAMMDYFQHSDLLRGLSFIPLDIACQGDDAIDDRQVAALLFPLQMHFKYLIADRQETASYMMERSRCNYAHREETESAPSSAIQMSPAMPVPVVPGYFPLDEAGAIEPLPAAEGGSEAPSLGPFEPLGNEYGPCQAMCRGACGPDCEPNNCTSTAEMRCEKDENGKNTGRLNRILTYECGVHQGCIDHDACYDKCNRTYGCDTWAAAFCRHAQWQGTTLVYETGYCDQRAIEEYGVATAGAWSQGYGPQPMRAVYEYTDPNFRGVPHPEKCPVGKSEEGDTKPAAGTAIPTPEGPKWVRDGEPIINGSGARLEYRGGGSDPDFFTEARFQGTFTIYTLSETSIGVEDRWVDHEWEAYHVNIVSEFDAPPEVLVPGEIYDLRVDFSYSGTVAKDGGNPGARFQYGADRAHSRIIQPAEAFSFFPWAISWIGPDFKRWELEAPPARPGDTLQIWAGWWNCAVCNVTWNYRAE